MHRPLTARCTRRIRAPLDHLILRPSDSDQISNCIKTIDAAIVTWYMPITQLQRVLHARYEAEQFGELLSTHFSSSNTINNNNNNNFSTASSHSTSSDKQQQQQQQQEEEEKTINDNTINSDIPTPLGLVTLIAGRNYPKKQTFLEKILDPAPHPTISIRISVMDRIHWQRTAWMANSICPSICWGRLPQKIFSINLDYKNKVCIDATFDSAKDQYITPYTLDIPGLNFHLKLQDTGLTLFDSATPVVDGFLDNESALHRLALAREVNMQGLGGSVYRQMLWSSPSLPNTANMLEFNPGELFQRCFHTNPPIETPVAAWLVREVHETLLYKMEGEVEDENDPNSATTYGDRSLTERVQKKAMNRYNGFRDEVRGKVYSDLDGKEMPR